MGRGSNILVLVISAAFAAMAIFMIAKAETELERRTAITVLLFFGGCALAGAGQFFEEAAPPPDPTADRVLLRPRRLHPLAIGTASAMWSAAGYLGLRGDLYPAWLSWPLLIFGAVGAIVLLPMALNPRARLEIDREGFWDHRATKTKVPWSDVQALEHGVSAGAFIRAHMAARLNDPASYDGQRRRRNLFWRTSIDPIQIFELSPQEGVHQIAAQLYRLAPPQLVPPAPEYDDEEFDEDDDW